MKNVTLPIYEYALLKLEHVNPCTKEWHELQIEKNVPQDIKIYYLLKGDKLVKITLIISIPAALVTGKNVVDGVFYSYEYTAEYDVAGNVIINQVIVAEMIMNLIGYVVPLIMSNTKTLHPTGKPHLVIIPSLSKILLWVESLWKD